MRRSVQRCFARARHCERGEAIQLGPQQRFWIASAFTQGCFGGLTPRVARAASEGVVALLLAMTTIIGRGVAKTSSCAGSTRASFLIRGLLRRSMGCRVTGERK